MRWNTQWVATYGSEVRGARLRRNRSSSQLLRIILPPSAFLFLAAGKPNVKQSGLSALNPDRICENKKVATSRLTHLPQGYSGQPVFRSSLQFRTPKSSPDLPCTN